MAYEKPELLVLSHAAASIQNTDDGGSDLNAPGKAATHKEGSTVDGGNSFTTSTTSAAYEADE